MESNNLGVLLPEMRLDFWDALWQGQIGNEAVLSRRLKVLALPLSPGAPCCRCVLRLSHGDAYLDQIWRYGRERLRVAVGNLLPHGEDGVYYGVCRLTANHVYILACAMEGTDAEALRERAADDVGRLVKSLENYLDLESQIKEIEPIASLADLTGQ